MTEKSHDDEQLLATLRSEIDRIDDDILDLLEQRMKVADTIAGQKAQQGLVFRARREVSKLRDMQAKAGRNFFSRDVIFDFWRLIMATTAYRQRQFYVVCLGSMWLIDVVFAHFGRNIPVIHTKDLDEMLERQSLFPENVMCLLDKQRTDWWPVVAEQSPEFSIVAELPWRNDETTPQGYLLAQCPPDLEADADVLCLLRAPGVKPKEITAQFGENLVYHRADRKAGLWLLRLHDPDAHDSLEEFLVTLRAPLPESWQLDWLGRFPRYRHYLEF